MHRLLVALGESDCEDVTAGFLAQPVNAVSSLIYTVAAFALIPYAARATDNERTIRWLFIAALGATGIGSFLYHGPQGPGSQFLHDITFLAALAVIVVANLAVGLRWAPRVGWAALAAVIAVYSVILLVAPTLTNVFTLITAASVPFADIVLRRRFKPDSRWTIAASIAMALAIGFFLLGRTDGPLCDSDSLFQGHALWHILSAAALAWYFVSTGRAREQEQM